jgi:hypothetical protein
MNDRHVKLVDQNFLCWLDEFISVFVVNVCTYNNIILIISELDCA